MITKNPSYPYRVHTHEKPFWDGILQRLDQRLNQASEAAGAQASQEKQFLLVQLAGARDQVYEMARRLPGEVGELYEEDRHKLEQAVAAFDRVAARLGVSG